eukprot:TRINITY_DN22631_c0_g1_i1.p2 TRINITY_DN22631_c0_g1~~TRINITY_DN22631_c0_g1_i1.p2  ORF type:complete len:469 (+),score=40.18 TRINITY_DN22631_c0_g1_i1:75-1481(+)
MGRSAPPVSGVLLPTEWTAGEDVYCRIQGRWFCGTPAEGCIPGSFVPVWALRSHLEEASGRLCPKAQAAAEVLRLCRVPPTVRFLPIPEDPFGEHFAGRECPMQLWPLQSWPLASLDCGGVASDLQEELRTHEAYTEEVTSRIAETLRRIRPRAGPARARPDRSKGLPPQQQQTTAGHRARSSRPPIAPRGKKGKRTPPHHHRPHHLSAALPQGRGRGRAVPHAPYQTQYRPLPRFAQIQRTLEYYFSDNNLPYDSYFLERRARENPRKVVVPVEVIKSGPQLVRLRATMEEILTAVEVSEELSIRPYAADSEKGRRWGVFWIERKTDLPEWALDIEPEVLKHSHQSVKQNRLQWKDHVARFLAAQEARKATPKDPARSSPAGRGGGGGQHRDTEAALQRSPRQERAGAERPAQERSQVDATVAASGDGNAQLRGDETCGGELAAAGECSASISGDSASYDEDLKELT